MGSFDIHSYMSPNTEFDLFRWPPADPPSQVSDEPGPHDLPHARSYRPRNPRSCDFCHARKTVCRVEGDPPCAACQSQGKECTFTERSRKRKRNGLQSPTHVQTESKDYPLLEPGKSVSPLNTGLDDHGANWFNALVQPRSDVIPTDNEPREDLSSFLGGSATSPCRPNPIDMPDATPFLLSDTGESDPYLLKHYSLDHLQDPESKIMYRRIEQDPNNPNLDPRIDTGKPVIFMSLDHTLYDKYESRTDVNALAKEEKEVEDTCGGETGVRLVKLFFKYVYPYYPVVSRSGMLSPETDLPDKIKSLPLSLRAILCALGLQFMIFDDILASTLVYSPPSAHALYRICWLAISEEIHTPHLSTLQSCLLLLQRANNDQYVMDSPFRWSLLAWTISLAQSLGLSTDCTDWQGVPSWEKRLRRRLWWALYSMEKWSFMSAGLPAHIKSEDFDVLPLTSLDFVSPEYETLHNRDAIQKDQLHTQSHFYHLVELSAILSDILDTFFSIRASKLMATNFALTLERARPLRSRLQAWKLAYDTFASSIQNDSRSYARLDGNASLGLAYPVATMILFRALLRPLDRPDGTPEDKIMRETGQDAVRAGAKACCVEVVQYLEQVKRGAWDAFWHSWSRAGFAIASSFMMRLLITSTSQSETEELNSLITRWRWALRTGGGNAGNAMMSLGLLRLNRSLLKSGFRDSDEG